MAGVAVQNLPTIATVADDDWVVVYDLSGAIVGKMSRSVLLGAGTTVQPYDADLAVIAGLAKTDGNVIVGDGSNWVAESGATLRTSLGLGTGDTPTFAGLNDGPLAGFRNHLVNGCFRVAQRGTSFTSATTPANNDDTYLIDRWIQISDGNDILDVSQETTVIPAGSYASIKLDIETANKRAGILQIVEARNATGLIGETVTFSVKARKGASNATVDKLRLGIAAWAGTADSVTSDIVSVWGAEGSAPTLAANWTLEGSEVVTLTDDFQTFDVTADIDTASAKNIGVFAMVENDDGTVGDLVYIADAQLEIGSVATPFERRPFTAEHNLCQRYYWKSFPYATAPAQNAGGLNCPITSKANGTGGIWSLIRDIRFPAPMRAAPTLTIYSTGAASSDWYNETGGAAGPSSGSQSATAGFRVWNGNTTGLTGNNAYTIHVVAEAEL